MITRDQGAGTQGVMAANIVRLSYREKVSVATMKEILSLCLHEKLNGVQYEVHWAATTIVFKMYYFYS